MTRTKRPRGCPPVRVMPDPIPDTPENVPRSIMRGPPKRAWRFLQPAGDGYVTETPTTRRSPTRSDSQE